MTSAGRPLRFLGYLVGGWVSLRAAMLLAPVLWTMAAPKPKMDYIALGAIRDGGGPAPMPAVGAKAVEGGTGRVKVLSRASLLFAGTAATGANIPNPGSGKAGLASGGAPGFPDRGMADAVVERQDRLAAGSEGRAEAMPAAAPVVPRSEGAHRWSGTAWMLWRPDAGGSTVQAPLLGGSQAGVRLDYRLASGRAGQLALYGRLSRAFVGPSAEEGALGLAWRPGGLPVSLLAERRQRIGPGGRSGFALIAAGGFGPRELTPRVEAEGYGQAGIVGLPGADGFADGKASLGYRLTPAGGRGRLTIGGSLSGSVQPGAGRIDIGPQLQFRLPAGPAGLRLSTEWRARIAGDAHPADGAAVTLIADF